MSKRKPVVIEGREYQVIDRLGWQNGYYAVEVQDGDRERIAVSDFAHGPWRWHRPILLIGPPPCGQATP